MPVSKSKRTRKQPAPRAASAGAIPGLGALHGAAGAAALETEAAIAELKAAGRALDLDRLREAQELTFNAWEASTPKRRVDLATKALSRHPWCGDAYGVLAMAAPPNSDAAIHLWRLAAAAGEFALKAELGEDAFGSCEGDFWGLLETRPYMRARAGLSSALWHSGEREAAVEIDLELLRLNPNDNQGARYVVADRLLVLGRDADLERLFETYPDEESAFLSYSRALWSFRREGDGAQSRKLLTQAFRSNRHVPAYLLGRKPLPRNDLGYYEPGKDSEAVHYAETGIEAWRAIPGALEWLGARAPGAAGKKP